MSYAQAITYIDELPPIVQVPSSKASPTNPYYEEVIKEHPGIQSKIRRTETDYFGKYNETMPPPPQAMPRQDFGNQPRAVPIPDYPLKPSASSMVHQNYLPGGMQGMAQEQHLPIARDVATHYQRPAYPSTYPIVEHMDCSSCQFWQSKCERMYIFIIGALLIVILLLLRKVNFK